MMPYCVIKIAGMTIQISESDLDYLCLYRWCKESQPSGTYLTAEHRQPDGKSVRIKLHRLIAGATIIKNGIVYNREEVVDHINRNTWDNRRENLRLCTHSQNAMNSKRSRSNTSGYKGVSWKKDKQKWKAYLVINRRQIHLGYFDTKEEAAKARIMAAKQIFGDFFAEAVEILEGGRDELYSGN